MIRQTRFHRWRHSQRLVDAAKIVVRMIDRNHVAVILEFLRERIWVVGCFQILRVTPAMEAVLTDHVWSLEELVGLLEQKMIGAAA